MNVWWVMIFSGAVTYVMRLFFILILGYGKIPVWLHQSLAFVPLAVFSAIIFPELFINSGALDLTTPRVYAGVLAILAAWRTKNILTTILVGMITLWLFQALAL